MDSVDNNDCVKPTKRTLSGLVQLHVVAAGGSVKNQHGTDRISELRMRTARLQLSRSLDDDRVIKLSTFAC